MEMDAKSDKSHTHSISNVTNLQSILNSKADASHGNHVTYSTDTPLMDGTSSAGSASTVSRSDHRHPVDTSRAAQTSLDSHTSNTTSHITNTERTNWNTAYTHSQSSHAPSNAEPNQNAFSNVKIGDITIAADIKTDTLTLVAGDNVTLTPDTNGDSITISSKDTNTTYSAGTGISLSGTTFSNSGVRSIATGSSNGTISVNTNGTSTNIAVKGLGSAAYTASTAYDAAGTAQTKADAALAAAKSYTDSAKNDLLNGAGSAYDTLKELGDLINENVDAIDALETVVAGKADKTHSHDDKYYTETEINSKISTLNTSISGKANSSHTHNIADVTSLQTALDGKAASGHTHNYAGSSSVGGSATSAVKLDTSTAGDANTPVYFSGGKPVACTSLDLNTSGSSASCTGNSATATKLQTSRSISLSTGLTGTATAFDGSANITIPITSIKESYLSWGGKNLSGSVSPLDAACSNIHNANRFSFAKADGITIEYSTDGSTYKSYSTTDSAKMGLVSGIGSTYFIGARSSSTTVNDKLRITLNATDMGLYTRLQKLLINISTGYSSGSNVIIEKAMKGSESTFTTIGAYAISGWSGWNSIPISAAFGGGATQTSNIAVLRLTFGITGVNSEQTSNALTILDIIGIGDTYWSYPSTMAKTGHIYTYDSSQNTIFPANVTATTFVGALSGNATTATTANNVAWSGVTSKPSYYDAKAIKSITRSGTTFTYTCMDGSTGTFTQQDNNTDTKVTNTLATTTKAYITGTTSATTNTGTQVFDTGVYLDTTAGKLTADTFNGATFSGNGVATLTEVKTYLGI